MPLLDQFESVFKAASRERFHLESVAVDTVLLVTDLEPVAAQRFADAERKLLGPLGAAEVDWHTLDRNGFDDVGALLEVVEKVRPDVIVTFRNLFTKARKWPYSLGTYIDVITQATTTPVLLLPRPDPTGEQTPRQPLRDVMVVTDQLTGSDHLVSWAARLTHPEGNLVLAHIEDSAVFARYVDIISKISEIDTPSAELLIRSRLLKEPTDYIASCREALRDASTSVGEVTAVVEMGHRVGEFRRLVDEHKVDLVVFNTKDEDQLAMHGLAYPLAVEFRDVPLLML